MAIHPNDENTSVFFSINKARYEVLRESFGSDTKIKKLNFVIDGMKIFEPFRQAHMKNTCNAIIEGKLIENLAAQFFNWLVHYRRFFNSINVETSFYLLHGYKSPNSPEWWNHTYLELDKKIHRILDFTVNKRIRPMATLIPNVHVIDTGSYLEERGLEPVDRFVVPQMLRLNGIIPANEHVVIVTNDLPMMQNIYTNKRTHVMRISHRSCNFITRSKLFEFLSRDYKEAISNIPDTMLPYFYAINGDKNCLPLDNKLKKAKSLKVLQSLNALSVDELEDSSTVFDNIKSYLLDSSEDQRIAFNERVDFFNATNTLNGVSVAATDEIISQALVNEPDFENAADFNTTRFGDIIELNKLFQ